MVQRVYIPTNKLPVEREEGVTSYAGTPEDYYVENKPKPRQNYIIEPDLMSTLTGQVDLPEGAYLDPFGRPRYKNDGEELQVVRRPGLLPLVETPQGFEFVMPKLLDAVGNIMGGVAGGTGAGGKVLGSGIVRQAPKVAEALEAEKAPAFFSPVENAIAASKQPKADAQQWLGYLKNQPGVKADEIEHLGLSNLSGSLTKEELLAKVKEGQPQINEVWKGKRTPESIADTKAFTEYSRELAQKYDLNPEQNLAMYASIKKMDPAEIKKYEELQKKFIAAGETATTKYHGYQLPGGENYREMLLTTPNSWEKLRDTQIANDKRVAELRKSMLGTSGSDEIRSEISRLQNENQTLQKQIREAPIYKSSHWDEPNVLAHIRMNDRTVDGKKSLHIEEIQSDWHQQGRKQGYKGQPINTKGWTATKNDNGSWDVRNKDGVYVRESIFSSDDGTLRAKSAEDAIKIASKEPNPGMEGVPDAPFKKSWDELALKKAIRHAAENNYDQISWTPGEAQAARYDLSKQVNRIYLQNPVFDENDKFLRGTVNAEGRGGGGMLNQQVTADNIANYIGKEAAEKLINKPSRMEGPKDKPQTHVLEGDGLKVGGEGMRGFYDKMLVDKANALGKKFGVKVEKGNLPLKSGSDYKSIIKELGYSSEEWQSLSPAKRAEEMSKSKNSQPIHVMKLTPEFKAHILEKGFPLFSVAPTFTPISHDPFKMTPVDYSPDFT